MLNRSGNTTDNLCFRYRFRDVFSRFRCCVYNGTGPLFVHVKHNGNMELHVSATFQKYGNMWFRPVPTNRVPWRHSFARKCLMTFYWLTPLSDYFVNSDWLELVMYFHTNEQDSKRNAFMVNFLENTDLRRGFKTSLRDFWDRDVSKRTQKVIDMFFEGNVSVSSPTGYGTSLIYI